MASTPTSTSIPDPIGKSLSLTDETLVGEPRKRRNASPSRELETSSGIPDFHTIDIGHESSPSLSEVELQTPRPNLDPSGLTLRMLLRVPIPVALNRDEPQQMNSDDRFSHTILLEIQHMGQEQGDVPPLFQIIAQHGDRVAETSVNLGKTIVSLTFQAGVGLLAPSLQNSSPAEPSHSPWSPLHVVELAMVIGFAASFMGILLRHTCPAMARKMEKTGYLSAALGFFAMMTLFLPQKVMWIGWIASAVSLPAFTLAWLIPHRLGLGTAS
ncbi:hypothetical protein PVL29_001107 [Vitis rotundifolia]|uniref:Uncharacterized protein n=1 Tax=Vitis rotundifolia TaxID=103349 RepID=A0AA39APL0_VITRO|nr:hypothetical protein PVL29_001107 [Vitis rotundifolia]